MAAESGNVLKAVAMVVTGLALQNKMSRSVPVPWDFPCKFSTRRLLVFDVVFAAAEAFAVFG